MIDETSKQDLEFRLDEFRAAIAPDLYIADVFVPWPHVDNTVESLKRPIALLQAWADAPRVSVQRLADALQEDPRVLQALQFLFVAPSEVGFADGRALPAAPPTSEAGRYELASLVIDLGLRRVLPKGVRVADVVRHGVIAVDARRRGFRRRDTIEGRIGTLIEDALQEVQLRSGTALVEIRPSAQPSELRGRTRTVVGVDTTPIAAVAYVFQAHTGGRQQRDLRVTYPQLQEDLDQFPAHLILIADGLGVRQAPRAVLRELFATVASVMTTSQAEGGALADAIEAATRNRGARQSGRMSVSTLISATLARSPSITASDLPLSKEAAQLALAQYQEAHRAQALEFDPHAGVLAWDRPQDVEQAHALRTHFDSEKAAALLARRLEMKDGAQLLTDVENLQLRKGHLPLDRVLPGLLVIGVTTGDVSDEIVRATARAAREGADASIAVLLTADSAAWVGSAAAQAARSSLATSVVVLDTDDLVTITTAAAPRDAFAQMILEQADLSKANPFTTTGATPPRMYFGRSREAADLRAALSGNSVALLGGRRIGKTSLMQRVLEMLRAEGWNAHYADCQEAGDWQTFASLLNVRWAVDLAPTFAPSQMAVLVDHLVRRERNSRVVILLDEVDHLLRWDQEHDDGSVPEALFRACRALSQEGSAQFVFSGERFISERLWDPASPHWNFCRPLQVKQLAREAADALITQPLEDLAVSITRVGPFLDASWARTQGHPHLTQVLGESLVLRLNDRSAPDRTTVSDEDVEAVTETLKYKRHYVETYWGQATAYERLISALIPPEGIALNDLRKLLGELGAPATAETVARALQMLDLYGILFEGHSEVLELRAAWLPEAMESLGGHESVALDELGRVNG